MPVFRLGAKITLTAGQKCARVILPGGPRIDAPRHIWWNFVASSKERTDAAKEAWRAGERADGRFKPPPLDDAESIPAPDR